MSTESTYSTHDPRNLTGTTANSRGDWFRFQRSPPVSAPDAKADDSTGDCTWAGMTTKKDSNFFKIIMKTPF